MDNVVTQLRQAVGSAAAAIGISEDELDQGLEILYYGTSRVALEAGQAESQNIPLHEAVDRPEEFPTLFKVHHGLQDILVLELPSELLPIAKAARDLVEDMSVEPVRFHMAKTACALPRNSPDRALARFVLFEAVRLNLLVAASEKKATLAYADIDDSELSRLADDEIARLIEAQDDVFAEGDLSPVRPLHLLVAAALSRLTDTVDASIDDASIAEDVRRACEIRARAEEALQNIDPLDALLLRNWMRPLHGQQRLSFDRLADAHPLLFANAPNRNTLEKRLSRHKLALTEGKPLRHTGGKPGVTLIEILTASEEQMQ